MMLLIYGGFFDFVWLIYFCYEKFKEIKEFFEDVRVRGIVYCYEYVFVIFGYRGFFLYYL